MLFGHILSTIEPSVVNELWIIFNNYTQVSIILIVPIWCDPRVVQVQKRDQHVGQTLCIFNKSVEELETLFPIMIDVKQMQEQSS